MIPNNLQEALSYDPTKQSQSQSIQALNNDIDGNKITLPIYQRDSSWTKNKMVDLFNYQLYGKAPVAPLSFNKMSPNDDNVKQVKLISRELLSNKDILEGQLSIIDGQQRLSTNYKAYIDSDDLNDIVLDIKKGVFRLLKDVSKITKSQIPVGKLLNKYTNVLSDYLTKNMGITDFEDMTVISNIRTKLTQYNYTLHIANNMNEKEQVEWFEVLNNAGSKVSALQMAFAKLGSNDFDIYREYSEPFKNEIENFDLNNLFTPYTTNVSYPVALLNPELEIYQNKEHVNNYAPIPSDTKENQLSKLSSDDLKQIIQKTLSDLRITLDIFERNGLSNSISKMDYILYVSGYVAFHKNTNINEQMLTNWVNSTNFVNKSNPERRRMFTDLLTKE